MGALIRIIIIIIVGANVESGAKGTLCVAYAFKTPCYALNYNEIIVNLGLNGPHIKWAELIIIATQFCLYCPHFVTCRRFGMFIGVH